MKIKFRHTLILSTILVSFSYAQWPTSPDTVINVGWDSGVFKAISDNHGGAYIVRGAQYYVYCSRIDSAGNSPWTPQILDYDGDEIWFSDVASSSDGGLFVSYHDFDFDGPGGPAHVDIKVQKLDQYGNKMWGTGVTITPDNASGDPVQGELLQSKIIGTTDGGVYAIFGDLRDGGMRPNLFIQRISSEGDLLWINDGIRVANSLDGVHFLHVNENNDLTLVYATADINWNRTQFVQSLSENGVDYFESGGIEMPTRAGIFYHRDTLGNLFYRYGVDHVVRINMNLLPTLDWYDVLIDTPGDTYVSELCPDDSGGVFVSIYGEDGENNLAYFQRINYEGSVEFGEQGIPGPPSGYWDSATLTRSGDSFIYILRGEQQVAYKINLLGSFEWENIILFAGPVEYYPWPTAISDGSGGAIYLFEDDYYVWATKISAEGVLGGTSPIINQPQVPSILRISAYPNPFNPSTTIEYDIPEKSDVSLIIYDMTGRDVRTLISRSEIPGSYQVHWDGMSGDGRQVSAGMYFARLFTGVHSSTAKMVYLR